MEENGKEKANEMTEGSSIDQKGESLSSEKKSVVVQKAAESIKLHSDHYAKAMKYLSHEKLLAYHQKLLVQVVSFTPEEMGQWMAAQAQEAFNERVTLLKNKIAADGLTKEKVDKSNQKEENKVFMVDGQIQEKVIKSDQKEEIVTNVKLEENIQNDAKKRFSREDNNIDQDNEVSDMKNIEGPVGKRCKMETQTPGVHGNTTTLYSTPSVYSSVMETLFSTPATVPKMMISETPIKDEGTVKSENALSQVTHEKSKMKGLPLVPNFQASKMDPLPTSIQPSINIEKANVNNIGTHSTQIDNDGKDILQSHYSSNERLLEDKSFHRNDTKDTLESFHSMKEKSVHKNDSLQSSDKKESSPIFHERTYRRKKEYPSSRVRDDSDISDPSISSSSSESISDCTPASSISSDIESYLNDLFDDGDWLEEKIIAGMPLPGSKQQRPEKKKNKNISTTANATSKPKVKCCAELSNDSSPGTEPSPANTKDQQDEHIDDKEGEHVKKMEESTPLPSTTEELGRTENVSTMVTNEVQSDANYEAENVARAVDEVQSVSDDGLNRDDVSDISEPRYFSDISADSGVSIGNFSEISCPKNVLDVDADEEMSHNEFSEDTSRASEEREGLKKHSNQERRLSQERDDTDQKKKRGKRYTSSIKNEKKFRSGFGNRAAFRQQERPRKSLNYRYPSPSPERYPYGKSSEYFDRHRSRSVPRSKRSLPRQRKNSRSRSPRTSQRYIATTSKIILQSGKESFHHAKKRNYDDWNRGRGFLQRIGNSTFQSSSPFQKSNNYRYWCQKSNERSNTNPSYLSGSNTIPIHPLEENDSSVSRTYSTNRTYTSKISSRTSKPTPTFSSNNYSPWYEPSDGDISDSFFDSDTLSRISCSDSESFYQELTPMKLNDEQVANEKDTTMKSPSEVSKVSTPDGAPPEETISTLCGECGASSQHTQDGQMDMNNNQWYCSQCWERFYNKFHIQAGTRITRQSALQKKEIPEIICETDDFIIITKPPFWLTPGDPCGDKTYSELYSIPQLCNSTKMENLLSYFEAEALPYLHSPHDRYGCINGLDAITGGPILMAQNKKTFLDLKAKSIAGSIDVFCLVIVQDHVKDAHGYITAPINFNDDGAGSCSEYFGESNYYTTEYWRLTLLQSQGKMLPSDVPYSLILLRCNKSHTRLIRAQLASAFGHSVISDRQYGGEFVDALAVPLGLHVYGLSFFPPETMKQDKEGTENEKNEAKNDSEPQKVFVTTPISDALRLALVHFKVDGKDPEDYFGSLFRTGRINHPTFYDSERIHLRSIPWNRPLPYIIKELKTSIDDETLVTFKEILLNNCDLKSAVCHDSISLSSIAHTCQDLFVCGDAVRLRTPAEKQLCEMENEMWEASISNKQMSPSEPESLHPWLMKYPLVTSELIEKRSLLIHVYTHDFPDDMGGSVEYLIRRLPIDERMRRAVGRILGRPLALWRGAHATFQTGYGPDREGVVEPLRSKKLNVQFLASHPLISKRVCSDKVQAQSILELVIPTGMWLPARCEQFGKNPYSVATSLRAGSKTVYYRQDCRRISKLICHYLHPFNIQHNRYTLNMMGSHKEKFDYEDETNVQAASAIEQRSNSFIRNIEMSDFLRLPRVASVMKQYTRETQHQLLRDACLNMKEYCRDDIWYGWGANRYWIQYGKIWWDTAIEVRRLVLGMIPPMASDYLKDGYSDEHLVALTSMGQRLHAPYEIGAGIPRNVGYTLFSLTLGNQFEISLFKRQMNMYQPDIIFLQDVDCRFAPNLTNIGYGAERKGVFQKLPGGNSHLQQIIEILGSDYQYGYGVRGDRAEIILWSKISFGEDNQCTVFTNTVPEIKQDQNMVIIDIDEVRLVCTYNVGPDDQLWKLLGSNCDLILGGQFKNQQDAKKVIDEQPFFMDLYESIIGEPIPFTSTRITPGGHGLPGEARNHIVVRGLKPAAILQGYSKPNQISSCVPHVPMLGALLPTEYPLPDEKDNHYDNDSTSEEENEDSRIDEKEK